MVPQLPWVTNLGSPPVHRGLLWSRKGGSVGWGGESLTEIISDNSSPVLVVLLSCAGALNSLTLGLTWLVLLSHSWPCAPHSATVSPFHQTQEHQP